MKTPKPKKSMSATIVISAIIVILVIIYSIFVAVRPVKTVSGTAGAIDLPENTPASIAWPAYGQAAVGAIGSGVIATNGAQTAHPIASIAKLILAMAVLDKYPLVAGATGPTYSITQADVDLYHANLAQGGSLVPVNAGEKLTEYQMLQGLLIASGDNLADTLAIWTYGSIDNYLSYANDKMAKLGLKETHVADASGLSASTVSSASNLIILGEKSLSYPAIADIVSQPKVTLPIAGTLNNYDSILGKDGVVGIKTGNTNEAGGCFLSASKASATSPTILTAILGAKNLSSVLADSRTFIQANASNLKSVQIAKLGQAVGTYLTPWGQEIDAVASEDLALMTVSGEKITAKVSLNSIDKSAKKGDTVGTLTVTTASSSEIVPVVLGSDLVAPKYSWKLFHPFK